MNDEARFLLRIWEAIGDWISNSDKQEAADSLVATFIDSGHDLEDLYDADGECPFIDRALAASQITHDEENGIDEEDYDR